MILDVLEILLYFLFPYFKSKKQRGEEWQGIVEEKGIKSDFSLAKNKYYVIFKKDLGDQTKISMDEKHYNQFEVGRRCIKIKGADFPTQI